MSGCDWWCNTPDPWKYFPNSRLSVRNALCSPSSFGFVRRGFTLVAMSSGMSSRTANSYCLSVRATVTIASPSTLCIWYSDDTFTNRFA
jgi:hypothetical protein